MSNQTAKSWFVFQTFNNKCHLSINFHWICWNQIISKMWKIFFTFEVSFETPTIIQFLWFTNLVINACINLEFFFFVFQILRRRKKAWPPKIRFFQTRKFLFVPTHLINFLFFVLTFQNLFNHHFKHSQKNVVIFKLFFDLYRIFGCDSNSFGTKHIIVSGKPKYW